MGIKDTVIGSKSLISESSNDQSNRIDSIERKVNDLSRIIKLIQADIHKMNHKLKVKLSDDSQNK